jgi:hypothetical protein
MMLVQHYTLQRKDINIKQMGVKLKENHGQLY